MITTVKGKQAEVEIILQEFFETVNNCIES